MRCASYSTVIVKKSQKDKMARNSNFKTSLELLQDIANYEKLLERDDLESDIPPKRIRGNNKVKKKPVKTASKTNKVPPSARKVEMQHSIKLHRPTFSGKPQTAPIETPKVSSPRRRTRSAKKKKQPEPKTTRVSKFEFPQNREKSALWQSVVKRGKEGQSFKHMITTENTYERLIETIRNKSDDIDFGLLCNLLPKNIEYEKRRFHVNFDVDHSDLYPRGLVFSDDIDQFFKQLSDAVPKDENIPLI